VEIAASTLWGGEDFSEPRANFLETWGRDGFCFHNTQSGRLQPIPKKLIKEGDHYVEKENALFNSAIPDSRH
jgi:hypothetical protein